MEEKDLIRCEFCDETIKDEDNAYENYTGEVTAHMDCKHSHDEFIWEFHND